MPTNTHHIDPRILSRYFALRKRHHMPAYAWWIACIAPGRLVKS